MKARHRLTTIDVPQAETLPFVRTVVEALHRGSQTINELVSVTSFSARHVRYRLGAARSLRLIDKRQRVSSRGRRLLATERGSAEELAVLREAVRTAPIIRAVAPRILRSRNIEISKIARKLRILTGLSTATADRRAHVLLSWSRQRDYDLNRNVFSHS